MMMMDGPWSPGGSLEAPGRLGSSPVNIWTRTSLSFMGWPLIMSNRSGAACEQDSMTDISLAR